MTSPAFPEPPSPIPPTTIEEVGAKIERLSAHKSRWTQAGLLQRIELLKRCQAGLRAVADQWVADGCRMKGLSPSESLAGEEWLAGPMTTARNIRLLQEALEAGGCPTPPKLQYRHGGQAVAQVFPTNVHDRLMFTGFSAEVWIQRGKPATQGRIYRTRKPGQGAVCLILGAGNVSSIPAMDVLYKLFVEDEVVLLKMNPVNAHVGPHMEEAFAPLIEEGVLEIVYGGVEVGKFASEHDAVDTLHVTGSDRTYDAIVWGGDRETQEKRKALGEKQNPRPFTAELGCVTPVLVAPGVWSDAELEYQARHVASMVAQNASFNCNAAKILVTAKGWPQRKAFLAKLEEILAKTAPRKAYYPGAEDRYSAFREQYPDAKELGAAGEGIVPWTLIPDVPPKKGEYALCNEAFCGVIAETALDAFSPGEFLSKAVDFANNDCWGTLSCCVLVHPRTAKTFKAELDEAIANLKYGGIGVNCWPGVIYGLVVTTWGAFPGHTPEDIQSGTGVVHNTFLFDYPEKSVVKAPFVIRPTPAWFADHKNLAGLGRELLMMEMAPGWRNLARVVKEAIQG